MGWCYSQLIIERHKIYFPLQELLNFSYFLDPKTATYIMK